MKRVLITGIAGTGKSAAISELAARGYKAVDTHHDGLSKLVTIPGGEVTGLAPAQDWVWREDRIQELLATDDAKLLFLSGYTPNQGWFYPQFDHVILLTAPAAVIVQRLATRTADQGGKHPADVARILHLQQAVEPLLRATAGLAVDTSGPLDEVVATILRYVESPPPS